MLYIDLFDGPELVPKNSLKNIKIEQFSFVILHGFNFWHKNPLGATWNP